WSSDVCSSDLHDAGGQALEADRRGARRGRYLPHGAGGRVLRREGGANRQAEGDRGGPLLRWCGPAAHGLPRVRRVHDRLPPWGEEHPAEELPLPRREGWGRGPPADNGHRHHPQAWWRLARRYQGHGKTAVQEEGP